MKTKSTAFAVLVPAMVVAGGCAMNQTPEPKEQAAQTVVQFQNDAQATRAQVEKTLASLNALMKAPPQEVAQAYTRYAADVDAMNKQKDAVSEQSDEIKSRSSKWQSNWQKSQAEVKNPELKALNEQRRSEIMTRFEKINASFDSAHDAFIPFIANIEDVKTVVGNDVTKRGVDRVSAAGVVRKANTNGNAVIENIDIAVAESGKLANALSPGAVPAPQPVAK